MRLIPRRITTLQFLQRRLILDWTFISLGILYLKFGGISKTNFNLIPIDYTAFVAFGAKDKRNSVPCHNTDMVHS